MQFHAVINDYLVLKS